MITPKSLTTCNYRFVSYLQRSGEEFLQLFTSLEMTQFCFIIIVVGS